MYARRPTRPKPRQSQTKKWQAPVAGWVANRALSDPQSIDGPGAAVLDNFFPKSTSVALRRGSATVGYTAGDVTALFSYNNGPVEKFFAADEHAIYDVSAVPDPTQPNAGPPITAPVVASGYTGGDWIVVQFATTGGVYLVGVNGRDVGFLYDGTNFTKLSGATSGPTVTFPGSLTSANMAAVWVYKNRLFFARVGSMDAYYLPIDSVGGSASSFPLSGVFGEGGELLFGASWSLDSSGSGGLSEQCVFVSSEGEVAVYQGGDPSNAATWSKVGLYRIGAPLGRRGYIKGGGDLAIATTVGLVPLSKALTLDVTALNVAAVSYKIADAWGEAVARGMTGWQCLIWPEAKMALVSPKAANGRQVLFVSNAETGAWARFTGWTVTALHTYKGRLYFGSTGGRVVRASVGGDDDSLPYTGAVLPLFEDLQSPMQSKIATVGRARVMANLVVDDSVTIAVEFDMSPPAAPDATIPAGISSWNYGTWGSSIWSDGRPSVINQDWRSIGGGGYSISMWYQITSGSIIPLDAELIGMEMLFETTEVVG